MHGLRYWATAIGAGVLVGAACCGIALVPWVEDLEQEAGLRWLFQARGKVAAPDEVVIVAINRHSASRIWLPKEPAGFLRCRDLAIGTGPASHDPLPELPARWPRCLHATLVDRLSTAGARVVAFDILFRKRPPASSDGEDPQAWQDEQMARSFASRRVLIAQKLEEVDGRQKLVELSPVIANAALGAAPFPVYRGKYARVDEFKAFEDVDWATPTLPSLALQAYALDSYPALSSYLATAHPAGSMVEQAPPGKLHAGTMLQAACIVIRNLVGKQPGLMHGLRENFDRTGTVAAEGPAPKQLKAVLSMYEGPADRLINYYGPAGTFLSIGYDEALDASPERMRELFADRMVFVGYSEYARHEQVEHFSTVMTSDAAPQLSGVEIAATAFSNLLQDRSIRRAGTPYVLMLVFVSGLLATIIVRVLPWRAAVPVTMIAVVGGAGFVLHQFSSQALWIPFVAAFFIAVPASALGAFAWNFHTTWRQRENLRQALVQFIPGEVAGQFERNADSIASMRKDVECGCVATDAANFTPLAETMGSAELAEFLNRYFDALFRPVGLHGGFVSDVVGDAMLALWPGPSTEKQAGMLAALLQMRNATRHFNEAFADRRLMTRFGVDWGPITLATVGAHRHYEYRAVGDTVNTASRIQELNKKLGTSVLLSRRSIGPGVEGFLVREIGAFLLRGKSIPVDICELVELRSNATARQLDLCGRFRECVDLAHRDVQAAISGFEKLLADHPDDGPSAFYLQALRKDRAPLLGAFRVG